MGWSEADLQSLESFDPKAGEKQQQETNVAYTLMCDRISNTKRQITCDFVNENKNIFEKKML